jgi:hypothetical protein
MSSPDFVFPAMDSLLSQNVSKGVDANGIQNKIRLSENDNLTSALNLANTNSNQALLYGMYMSRNKTISDAAVDLTIQNKMFDNGTSETYARQGEINEWQAQNKFDTLFFLQCMFIYLMIFIIFMYLWRKGMLPSSTYYWIIIILTIVLVGIFWNRYMYTRTYRDNRYWNRRYLGLDKSMEPTQTACESTEDGTSTPVIPDSANPT